MSANPEDDFRVPPPGMDADAHADALSEGLGRLKNHKIAWLILPLAPMGLFAAGFITRGWPGWLQGIAAFAGFLSPAVVISIFLARRMPKAMGAALRAHGANVCANCGYDLDRLGKPDRCPECGTLITAMPERGSARPKPSPIVMPPSFRDRSDDSPNPEKNTGQGNT